MKVLYVASNSKDAATLRVEQEITELQRAASQVSGDPVTFIFLPALPFEEIEQQVAIFRPDILHITAHGEPNELYLSNSIESKVPLTSAALQAILRSHVPRLIYINACTSEQIASDLVGIAPHTIGTSAAITNFAARKSAVTFYRYLLRGQSLEAAISASSATAEVLDQAVKTRPFSKPGYERDREYFYSVPKLMAYFNDHKFAIPTKSGYSFQIGVAGASESTMQIVFCTDDDSFLDDEEADDMEGQLCSVVRTNAIRGEVWAQEDHFFDIHGDFRLYALGITSAGRCYSLAGTLCEAITNFYQVYYNSPESSKFPAELRAALEFLQNNDGSVVRPRKDNTRSGQKNKLREKSETQN